MHRIYFRFAVYLVVAILFSPAKAGTYEDFFRAVAVDNASAVTELLQRGFDPNARSEQGQTALYLSVRDGSPKVIQALLDSPALQIDAPNAAGETPLMMAALRGRTEWVQTLLDRGAKTALPGWNPLHYAATGEQGEPAVRLLLDRGAAIDARSPNGSTALMMAARYGSEASVKLLLARGADPRLRNQREMSPADFARSAGRDALAQALELASR
ncbi:MAG: ankyrin repeat domain-containing protein [Burkholderiales bacterium]|nr:ankyrin repeat domain-containing protein [Burkholderiales bacterium]